MSDQPKPADTTNNNNKGGADEEEEDEGYSCKKCWYGYCACVVWTCKVIAYLYLVCL
jgi:hypothetical protein